MNTPILDLKVKAGILLLGLLFLGSLFGFIILKEQNLLHLNIKLKAQKQRPII